MTIDESLEIDLVDAFEVTNLEGVENDKLARKVCLDITFPKFRIKPFKRRTSRSENSIPVSLARCSRRSGR